VSTSGGLPGCCQQVVAQTVPETTPKVRLHASAKGRVSRKTSGGAGLVLGVGIEVGGWGSRGGGVGWGVIRGEGGCGCGHARVC